jgi:hypothetical protein
MCRNSTHPSQKETLAAFGFYYVMRMNGKGMHGGKVFLFGVAVYLPRPTLLLKDLFFV